MTKDARPEIYISVDVEAAGPTPGEFSMLSLGACVVGAVSKNFYVELKPVTKQFIPEALKVSGLSLEKLSVSGKEPHEAMGEFRKWVEMISTGHRPVFVGFNAVFDWAFVNWYFHRFLGENPFGIGGIDIKAYYMGLFGCDWHETSSSQLPARFQPSLREKHNALADAQSQAEVFEKLLEANHQRKDRGLG